MGQIVSDVTEVLDYNKSKKEASSARQKILAQMAADDVEKTNLVKKALASQRAKYGAGGVSNSGTSSSVVLSRLKSEAAAPYEQRKRANIDKLKQVKVSKPNLLKNILSRFDQLVG